MQLPPNEPEAGARPDPEEPLGPQDSYRRIMFGQLSDPLLPAPYPPTQTPEEELTRAALEDPDALQGENIDPGPTTWRWVFLLLLAVGALAIVFRKH